MKWTVKDLKYGEIVYEEPVFVGEKKLILNGMEMVKEKRRTYVCPYGEEEIRAKLRGNVLTGMKLKIEDDEVILVQYARWYEILLSLIIFPIMLLLGEFLPLFNDALIGFFTGAMSGLGTVLSIWVLKKFKKRVFEIISYVVILVLVFLASYFFAMICA